MTLSLTDPHVVGIMVARGVVVAGAILLAALGVAVLVKAYDRMRVPRRRTAPPPQTPGLEPAPRITMPDRRQLRCPECHEAMEFGLAHYCRGVA